MTVCSLDHARSCGSGRWEWKDLWVTPSYCVVNCCKVSPEGHSEICLQCSSESIPHHTMSNYTFGEQRILTDIPEAEEVQQETGYSGIIIKSVKKDLHPDRVVEWQGQD